MPITERALDGQVGKTLDVLVEERVQGEELSLGRAYLQAPEVDGLVVVRRQPHSRGHGAGAHHPAQRGGPRSGARQ